MADVSLLVSIAGSGRADAPELVGRILSRGTAVNRDHAQNRMHSHVKWLDGLRNELTQHCYGKPEPEVVGVPGDAALDAAVEARLRG